MQGRSFAAALRDEAREHRPFVVSSWPLYFAEGEMTTAVDSRPRRIASYMPITITTRERSVILGGASEPPELYDLEADPGERENAWEEHVREGGELGAAAIEFLEKCETAERFLEPRRSALETYGSRT
jgi:hypothetical protein